MAAAGEESAGLLCDAAGLGVGVARLWKKDGKPLPAFLVSGAGGAQCLGLEAAALLLLAAVSLESHASGEKAALLLPRLLSSCPWSRGCCLLLDPLPLHHLMAKLPAWFLCVFVSCVVILERVRSED